MVTSFFSSDKKEKTKEVNNDKTVSPALTLQGANASNPIDAFARDNKENVWKREEYQTTRFDRSDVSASMKGLSEDHVFSLLKHNVVGIRSRIIGDIKSRPGRAVCIGGHIYMTNNHTLTTEGRITLDIVQEAPVKGVTRNVKVEMNQEDVLRCPDQDVCFFECLALPPKKDITKLFMEDTFSGISKGYLFSREITGAIKKVKVDNICRASVMANETNKAYDHWKMYAEEPTIQGDCGSLLVMFSPAGVILGGIHQLGSKDNTCFSLRVPQSLIKLALSRFERFMIQSGEPVLSAPGHTMEITNLHFKSTLRWMTEGSASVYGSFTGFRARMTSKVTKSLLHEQIVSVKNWAIKFGKPVMNTYVPWRLALSDIFAAKHNYNRQTLDKCKKSFTKSILDKLSKESLDELQVLSDRAAVNGIAVFSILIK
jgi:hypothetical protein